MRREHIGHIVLAAMKQPPNMLKKFHLTEKTKRLIKVIREGQTTALGMPAYGWMISNENASKIIEYLRELKKNGV